LSPRVMPRKCSIYASTYLVQQQPSGIGQSSSRQYNRGVRNQT
jgi:hypothetical protein